jgi:hypothetical protein
MYYNYHERHEQDYFAPTPRLDTPTKSLSSWPTPPPSPGNPASPRRTLPQSISARWSFPLPPTTSWETTKAYNPTPPIPQTWPTTTTTTHTTTQEPTSFFDLPIRHEGHSYIDLWSRDEDLGSSTWFDRHFGKLRRRLRRKQ